MTNLKKDLPEEPFDPDEDRPVEADELYFLDDEEQSYATLSSESDSVDGKMPNEDSEASVNLDNLDPEVLIKEDGARSPYEPSATVPADEDLTVVDIDDIGAGYGLDEAELARIKPLDGKPEP